MNSLVLLVRPKGLVTVASRAASAAAAQNPVQRLFIEKVREFKTTNKGLDEVHQKTMEEEMKRLKRVYKVQDESKLAHLDHKFSAECDISLRDIDESKELRKSIASGEYQKQIAKDIAPKSELLESIPEQVIHDLHLPPQNKPNMTLMLANENKAMAPLQLSEPRPDFSAILEPMTPEKLQREMCVKFGPDMPTINDDKAPARDVVNFPIIPQAMDTPPTRHHIIPESWFQFLYPKTGASGLYTLAASFGTFLFSKEWLIYEHEMIGAISMLTICTYAVIKYGPTVSGWIRPQIDEEISNWDKWQNGNIATLSKLQDHYSKQLNNSELIEDLYKIREHDINLQTEHEYRSRLHTIHNDVKRRLGYLVSVADTTRQIAHQNMVNWVIKNAVSSIGPKQEQEVLDSCILNLKQLGNKNANLI